jgi:hypothetical protein
VELYQTLIAGILVTGLPLAGAAIVVVLLLAARQSGKRERGGRFAGATIVRTVARTVTTAVARTVQVSVVHQMSTVAHITVEAMGYLVTRLQGGGVNGIMLVTRGLTTRHVVRRNATYTLTIECRKEAPEHYEGAHVKRVELRKPVTLELEATGEGFAIGDRPEGSSPAEPRDPWRTNMTIEPQGDQVVTLKVTPRAAANARLSVQVFHDEAWVQRVDFDFDVDDGTAIDARLAAAEGGGRIDGEPATAGAVETATTLSVLPEPARRALQLTCRLNRGSSEQTTYAVRAKKPGSDWRRLNVTLREDDLADVNALLCDELDRLRGAIGDGEASSPAETAVRDRAVEDLARRGNAALKLVFPDEEDRSFLHAVAGSSADVEISTDCFFLPWELLCFDETPERAGLDRFWGFKWNVSRTLTNIGQRASPNILVRKAPRVAMFVNPELKYAREHEAGFLHQLAGSGQIALWDWDLTLAAAKPAAGDLRRAFVQFCRERESEIAHFACHAVADAKIALNSYLELSSDLAVSLVDMVGDDYRLAGAPLVLLNACGTAVRDPRRTADFVHRFTASGGRGVLATESDIPDRFASRFIQAVYGGLLSGLPVGEAVLEARRHFLTTEGNPLGLFYSVYAPLETRLVREGMTAPREGRA